MYYYYTMQANFESEKNKKASIYTAIICGLLLLLFFFITWPAMQAAPTLAQDLIEVNLGNDMEGYGEEQPLIKGEQAPAQEPAPAPQQTQQNDNEEAAKPVTDDNDNEDAAAINKPEKKVTKPTIVKDINNTKPVKSTTNTTTTTPPTPKPQKPKFPYKGNRNDDGNDATEDNDFRNQGNNKKGLGDKGSPNGKPDSYGNDPGGRTSISVKKGAKPLNMGVLRFEDDFNENAKVLLEVKYNSTGLYISSAAVKGTTTSNGTILSIAKRKAAQLKFPPNEDGGVTTILFNFKVQN